MALERVQKILARAGIASRRKAEELILEGSVTINGVTAKLGDQAEWGKDAIKVDGKLLTETEAPVYLAFYKPKNVICAMSDPQGRPALADYFTRVQARIYPIGKLDFESEGLVLLTNDGEMAQKIAKSKDLLQVYSIKVKGHPDAEMLKRISRGMKTEKGHLVRPEVVRVDEKLEKKAKVQVVMRGSAATELKALLETRGFLFDRLVRTGIGQITLGELETGEYRRLEASQVRAIFEQPELGMRTINTAVEKDAEAAARRERRETRAAAITPAGAKRPRARVSSSISPRGEGAAPASRPAPKSAWGGYQPKSDRGPRPASGTRGPRPSAFGGEGAAPRARTSRSPMPRAYEGAPESRAPRAAKPFGEKRGGFGGGEGRAPRSAKPFGESRGPRSAKPFGEKRGGFSGASRGPKPFGGGASRGGPRKPRSRD
jgi:pseudouridine synthase